MFIFRPKGFVINYANIAFPEAQLKSPSWIRNQNNSIYAPNDQRWQDNEIEFALEKANIHIKGFDPTDKSFLDQYVGWIGEDYQRFFTMQEYINSAKKKIETASTLNEKVALHFKTGHNTLWNLYKEDPKKAAGLAAARINQKFSHPLTQDRSTIPEQPLYTTSAGIALMPSALQIEIEKETPVGQKAVAREMYTIEAYERLLKDHQII